MTMCSVMFASSLCCAQPYNIILHIVWCTYIHVCVSVWVARMDRFARLLLTLENDGGGLPLLNYSLFASRENIILCK